MYVVCVTVFIRPEFMQRFIQATLANARTTRKEAGNARFDVLQCTDDPKRFLLYEAYQSKEDFTAHQQTEHYVLWKQTVGDWMAQPRQGIKHNSLFWGDGQ